MFFNSRNWWKSTYWWDIIFEEKRQKVLENKLNCKFIRINTSNAKNSYDLDYEVGNVQEFIDEFKNKKIIYKRKRNEREIRKKTKRQKQRIKEFNKQPSY